MVDSKFNVKYLITPTYITDVGAFSHNVRTFGEELRKEYSNARIGYSLKTNYHVPFLKEVRRLGEMAEIVSPMEYNFAVSFGKFKPKDIIYNGVIPDIITKIQIAIKGGIVNFDNIDQLKEAESYVASSEDVSSCIVDVGVRLNFDMRNDVVSRFGVDVDNRDEMDWLFDPQAHPHLRINKLHCHFSGAREVHQFRRRVEKMARYARWLRADTIDIGGNMFGVLSDEFSNQYECIVPSLYDYANAIGYEMKKQFPDENVRLIVEGGTPFVTNAMHLLTSIRNVKNIRGHQYVTVDCRNEDVGWTCRYKEPVVRSMCKCDKSHSTIFGSECTETDIIRRSFYGPVEKGGLLLIRDIGAYSSNLVNDFITYGCKMFIDVSELENPEILPV